MKCPACKTDLVVTGQAALETLNEHVMCHEPTVKAVFQCPNKKCKAHEYGAVWNHGGEYYSYNMTFEQSNELKEKYFIGKNDGPFGTITRRLNVEVSCAGLKKSTWLSSAWTLGWLKPVIRYKYKSNEDGEVLEKGWNMEFYRRDRGSKKGSHCILWHSDYHMIKFCLKQFLKRKESFEKATTEKNIKFTAKRVIDEFKESSDKRRYKRIYKWLINFFYPRLRAKATYYL